jgi:NAD(P)-dependent dehydrogenase (short-subunit alcohol dehydrogenase family)
VVYESGVWIMAWPEQLNFMKNARLPQKSSNKRIDGQIVLITGATSGVGLDTMKHVLEFGGFVILIIRNKEKAMDIISRLPQDQQKNTDIFVSDLSSFESVKNVVSEIKVGYKKVDIVVNNAGIHNTKKKITKDGYEEVLQVNHLSGFLLTQLLLPLNPSKIIQISSEGHRFGDFSITDPNFIKRRYSGLKSYANAKTAQIHCVYILAEMFPEIIINAVHPGEVKSHIGMNNGFFYRSFKKLFINLFLKPVEKSGSAIFYHIAEDINLTGRFFNLTIDETPAKHAQKSDRSKIIYEWSYEQIKPFLGDKNE